MCEEINLKFTKKSINLVLMIFVINCFFCIIISTYYTLIDWMIIATPISLMGFSFGYLVLYYLIKNKVKK